VNVKQASHTTSQEKQFMIEYKQELVELKNNGIRIMTFRYAPYDLQIQRKDLLFLHGLGMASRSWDEVVSGLNSQHNCCSIDLPGHGYSSGLGTSYSDAKFGLVLSKYLEQCHAEPLVLIGHSLGASALLAAMSNISCPIPCAIVLVDHSLEMNPAVSEFLRKQLNDFDRAFNTRAELIQTFLGAFPTGKRDLIQHLAEYLASVNENGRWSLRTDPNIESYFDAIGIDEVTFGLERMAELKIPMLLIKGQYSSVLRHSEATHFKEKYNAHLQIIAGAGHSIPIERPLDLSICINRFLDSI
jgi:2-succinyl-6-hydroxy-2,4-cyclohexadiene-1-carboxylate synthase